MIRREGRVTRDNYLYELPEDLIAQEPAPTRSGSRLLRLEKGTGLIEHLGFLDLPSRLREDDLLVINDVKVFPARLRARRKTGGHVELFLLSLPEGGRPVPCLVRPARRVRDREQLELMDGSRVIVGREENGFTLEHESGDLAGVAQRLGEVPLPPYIKRTGDRNRERDRERYQTIFARRSGAVAAPTAGLHFDDRVVSALNDRGVEIVPVTLHVGPGTFAPVRVRDVRTHTMESELYEISLEAADSINRARRNGRRVVAVGTTVVRAVESAAVDDSVRPGRAWTDLFIFPGYGFRIVDALVTNFHLPGSSLLMLVCAFGGTEKVMVAYREAVRAKYRFYSYGDAMFIE